VFLCSVVAGTLHWTLAMPMSRSVLGKKQLPSAHELPLLEVELRQTKVWTLLRWQSALTLPMGPTCGLTFELTGPRRQDAWPAKTRIQLPALPARRPAVVGPAVERGVRPHFLLSVLASYLMCDESLETATQLPD
jgi:hypothetical protein